MADLLRGDYKQSRYGKLFLSFTVPPHAPDGWIDGEKRNVGYVIPFNQHFHVFKPPHDLAEIGAELKTVSNWILKMIGGFSK